jgi:small subunit ribosomal protein S20
MMALRSSDDFCETCSMANTSSAKKAVRQIERRTAVNKSRRSQMRTFVRKVEEALASGDQAAADAALKVAAPLMMRAAQKGIVHKNTASRKVSRLSKRVKSLAA